MIIIGHCGGCHLGRLEVTIKKIDLCQSEKAYLGYYEFKNVSYRILFYIKESITTHQITLLDRVCISTKICEPDDNDPRHRGSCNNCV